MGVPASEVGYIIATIIAVFKTARHLSLFETNMYNPQNIVKEIKQYQEKWLQHVQRMDTDRLPKQALQYKPKGQRNIG